MRKILNFFHYLFIPSERNDQRAKALHTDFLTAYLVVALFLVFSFKGLKTAANNVLGFATDITIQKLYQLTNDERSSNNEPTLTYDEALSKAAYLKAQNMFAENYWAHYSPDGKSPWDFINVSGYKYEYAGENLAKNFLFSKDVVHAWMNSPSHRENILRKEFKDVGFAVVNGVLEGEQTTLVVQMFGTKPAGVLTSGNSPNNLVKNVQAQEAKVSKTPEVSKNKVSLLASSSKPSLPIFSFNLISIFIVFLILVLLLDLYYAYRLNFVRIHSKNLAHLIFLGAIFIGLIIFIKQGLII